MKLITLAIVIPLLVAMPAPQLTPYSGGIVAKKIANFSTVSEIPPLTFQASIKNTFENNILSIFKKGQYSGMTSLIRYKQHPFTNRTCAIIKVNNFKYRSVWRVSVCKNHNGEIVDFYKIKFSPPLTMG